MVCRQLWFLWISKQHPHKNQDSMTPSRALHSNDMGNIIHFLSVVLLSPFQCVGTRQHSKQLEFVKYILSIVAK